MGGRTGRTGCRTGCDLHEWPAAYRPNRSRCGLVDERHREVPDRLLAALAVPARLLAVQKPLADEPVELAAGLRDLDLARVLLGGQDPRAAAGGETVRISAGEVDQVDGLEHGRRACLVIVGDLERPDRLGGLLEVGQLDDRVAGIAPQEKDGAAAGGDPG